MWFKLVGGEGEGDSPTPPPARGTARIKRAEAAESRSLRRPDGTRRAAAAGFVTDLEPERLSGSG
ncbi:MAG: hypothetical protein B7X76_04155 [Azorhizobium sp. 39-67-5]|nr:MAG: hypothetical protein B7X76_04155 [Azorhizobium sp. 39-67-5]